MTNPGFGPPTPEGVCRWLAAMDDPTDDVGMAERQTVTLTKIIDQARAALDNHDPVEPCPEQGIGDHDCAEHQLGCFRCGHDPLDDHNPGGCTRCGCTSPFGGLT